jgi:hypothetical protein
LDDLVGFKMQPKPDAFIDFSASTQSFKGLIAVDLKTEKPPGLGRSIILGEIGTTTYIKVLIHFEDKLRILNLLTPEIKYSLGQMVNNVEDFKILQDYWFNCVTLLEHTQYIPPLRIPKVFNTEYLTPKSAKEYETSVAKMRAVSEELYKKKISEHYQHPSLPDNALDAFNGSQMQQILNS